MEKHKIATIQDLVDLVDENNIEQLIDDTKKLLVSVVSQKMMARAIGSDCKIEVKEIIWVDDNKGEVITNFEVGGEVKAQFVISDDEN